MCLRASVPIPYLLEADKVTSTVSLETMQYIAIPMQSSTRLPIPIPRPVPVVSATILTNQPLIAPAGIPRRSRLHPAAIPPSFLLPTNNYQLSTSNFFPPIRSGASWTVEHATDVY
jgi:hypothetical protein